MSTAELTNKSVSKISDKPIIIEANNLGPISHAKLTLPKRTGVMELQGMSGIGKSTLLRCLNAGLARTKPESVSVKDRELHGDFRIDGYGFTCGARVLHNGELEFTGIAGLDIGDFIDPKIDNVISADAKRIRWLTKLSGQSADVALFYPLVEGGQEAFEALLPNVGADEDDLLKLAGRVKRGLEEAARKSESAADQERGHALACAEAAKSVDLTAESDSTVLQKALETALEQKTLVERQFMDGTRAKSRYDAAKKQLDAAQAELLEKPSIEVCRLRSETALNAKRGTESALEVARRALALAESNDALAGQELKAAHDAQDAAVSRQKAMEGWEQALKDGEPVIPSEDELNAATNRATAARKAVEQGALIRKAKLSQDESETHLLYAQTYAKQAEKYRNGAASVDSVLSGVVSRMGDIVRVESDRLVTDTVRGKTYVAELSDGERCRIAMHLFLDRMGTRESTQLPRGVMTMDQRFWGELPPYAKDDVAAEADTLGILVITARATNDKELSVQAI